MVSERVITALQAVDASGFVPYPVDVSEIESPRLRKLRMPRYFYLEYSPGIVIDWRGSGLNEPCSACGAPLRAQIDMPERLIPVEGTWNGAEIFSGDPYGGPFCTERMLLLAREHRWTNFVFHPLDVLQEHAGSHNGIDYLGKQWPPNWYPDRPSAGKALEQWLEDYFSDVDPANPMGYRLIWDAERALEDLGDAALPALLDRFKQGSGRAAHGIYALSRKGIAVPPDILDVAESLVLEREFKANPHLFERDETGRLRYKSPPKP